MAEMEIKVLEIRRLSPGTKSVRAFADVQFGNLILKDFRIMQYNGARPYVKAPFSTYKNKNGELCFRQIIDLPDEVRGQVDTAILSAFYREMGKQHDNQRE